MSRFEIRGIQGSPSFPGVHPWTAGKAPRALTMSSKAPSRASQFPVALSPAPYFTAPPKVTPPDFNYSRREESALKRTAAAGSAPSELPGRKGPWRGGSGGLRPAATGLGLPSRAGPSCTASAAPPRPRAATPSQPSACWRRSTPWSRLAELAGRSSPPARSFRHPPRSVA